MFTHYNHLGFITPFYLFHNQQLITEREFSKIITHVSHPREIDICGLIEMISRYHCFADRTLIKGISRAPWMARPDATKSAWEYADLPAHGNFVMPEDKIAEQLFDRLQEEILNYCKDTSTVGLLLSGGMDSRIVAGVLDYLQKTKQLAVDVVAITWGMEHTRDVQYAQRIAERLGWSWVHYALSAEVLNNNIQEAAKRGCEYSPVHLHATPMVREIQGVDCILGASYGDSIGRAEYSGKSVKQLVPFEQHILNWFKLLKVTTYHDTTIEVAKDIRRYRELFPRERIYQQHEIDQQAHYMRRKLNHCMGVINENVPFHQVFSSPDVFGYMWSLSPDVRNDKVYKNLMGLFLTELTDIPWARTGIPYLAAGKPVDNYPSLHHQYGKWIREDLYQVIKEKVLSSNIDNLGVFNMHALESALETNRKLTHQIRATKVDELSIWLAALSEFVAMYDIKGFESEQSFTDVINGWLVSPLQVAGLATSKFVLSRK